MPSESIRVERRVSFYKSCPRAFIFRHFVTRENRKKFVKKTRL